MKKLFICSSALLALSASLFAPVSLAQDASHWFDGRAENGLIEMPLPKGEEAYRGIDGKHIWQYVVELAKVATDYRDNGHPQYWGRIAGTEADAASAQWLQNKFRQIGLTDVHAQTLNYFLPQWDAKSWSVTLTDGDKSLNLVSAEPSYGSPATDGKELNLEVAYVGLGSEADFAGRDVRGKAAVMVIGPLLHNIGADDVRKRAMEHGAAAILGMELRDGNYKMQAYPAGTNVPTFHLGAADGEAIRSMVGAGVHPHLKIRMDASFVPGRKSALVWGALPGATDETIYVFGHRDGWFQAAADNGSGVATMLGIAEHFAKIPKAQRRRTMIFIGTDGHHNSQAFGMAWLAANHARLFAKTALVINSEHPAPVGTHGGPVIAGTTTIGNSNEWYAGGASRPKLAKIATDAFREFGVPVWTKPSDSGAGGDLGSLRAYVPGVAVESNDFLNMHYELDTPDDVSWSGLQAITRAYSKIIDEVNKLPLSDLQRPDDTSAVRKSMIPDHCEAWIKDSSANCVP